MKTRERIYNENIYIYITVNYHRYIFGLFGSCCDGNVTTRYIKGRPIANRLVRLSAKKEPLARLNLMYGEVITRCNRRASNRKEGQYWRSNKWLRGFYKASPFQIRL